MATTVKHTSPQIAKAEVTVPVPASSTRFMTIGGTLTGEQQDPRHLVIARRQQNDIYYGMYREHPTVRAATEKIVKVAISTGYMFAPAEVEEALPKDRAKALRTFFRKSNAGQLLKATYKDLLIYGDAYWWVQRSRNGMPIYAKRLHPKFTDIRTSGVEIVSYRYGPVLDEKSTEYDPSVIIHFRLDDPDSDLYGLSLLHSLQRTVATDLFAMDYNSNFFENSAQTGIIFNMKNTSPDEVERNRAWLEINYVGTKNAHRPLILEGDVEVQKSISSPADMEFHSGRDFARQEILSVLDVPPSKVSIPGHSNRSTAKEDDNNFRSENIAPFQAIVEEEISNSLILNMFGWDDIVFRHREVSKRDMIELTKMLAELERMGVYSINEIRGELGLADIDAGDTHFVQTSAGLIPLELIFQTADRLLTGLGTGGNGLGTPAPQTAGPGSDDGGFDVTGGDGNLDVPVD